MRDAAALVILQMDKATGISSLSKVRSKELQSSQDQGAAPTDEPPLQATAAEENPDEAR
jgi:hypothetical protein